MRKYPHVVRCLQCCMVLVSNDVHDYKVCGCPNKTMIDGGYDYLRCGGVDHNKVEVLQLSKKFILGSKRVKQ